MANRIKLAGTTANSFTIGLNGVTLNTANIGPYQLNLPANVGANAQVLTTDGTGNLSWTTPTGGGGNGTPGGSNTQIQYNNAGAFDGSAAFTFNNTSNLVSLSANLSIGNGITTTDFVNFDTANVGAGQVAQLTWNDGEGTLDLGLKGGNTTLNIGTQEYARVYNAEATTLNKGEVVYVFGAQGNRLSVKRARANVEATSFGTVGLVSESIAAGAEGYIIVSGALYKLNTNGLIAGGAVYLSPSVAGGYTQTKPVAPDQLVVLGWVERVDNTVGSIYVKVDNGYELDELHDVLITSPIAGQALVYNSSNLWVNGNAAYSNTAGTVTTNAQPNITSVGTLTSLSVSGNANVGNLNTTGIVSATGNITAPFFIGNGSLLTGISGGGGSSISNGTSNVNITTANGNVVFNIAGTNSVLTVGNLITSFSSNVNITSNLLVGGKFTQSSPGLVLAGTGGFRYGRVKFGDNKFINTNSIDGSATNQYRWSLDGYTWFTATLPISTNWTNVGYGNGIWIIINNSNQTNYQSFDGINWFPSTLPTNQPWTDIDYGNGIWAAYAGNGQGAYSTNQGVTWIAQNFGNGAFNRGLFIKYLSSNVWAICNDQSGSVLTSTNLITWTSRTTGASALRNVIYAQGQYIAFGKDNSGPCVYTSTNLTSWTRRTLPNAIGSTATCGAYYFNKYYCYGEDRAWHSWDGITWFNNSSPSMIADQMIAANGLLLISSSKFSALGVFVSGGILNETYPLNNTLNGTWTFTGNITANNLTTSNIATIPILNVSGNANIGNLSISGNTTLSANLAQAGGTPLSATDTTIAFKIPITINGTVYYLALTAAQ